MLKKISKFILFVAIIVFLVFVLSKATKAVTYIFVPQGGTGAGSFTANQLIVGNGVNALQSTTTLESSLEVRGSATTTGFLYLQGGMLGSSMPAGNCTDATDKLLWNNSTGVFTCGTDATGGGGGGTVHWTISGDNIQNLTATTSDVLVVGTLQASSTAMFTGVLMNSATTTGNVVVGGTITGDLIGNVTGNADTATALTDFGNDWLVVENASTTTFSVTDNLTFWNNTSTWAGFLGEWNKYTNASSTIITQVDMDTDIATHLAVIADTNTIGHLNDTDWDTFNGKQSALGFTPVNSADWTTNNSYPVACLGGEYAHTIGDTLSCTDATTEIDSVVATHLAVVADTNTIGHLNDTDWDTFNNKVSGVPFAWTDVGWGVTTSTTIGLNNGFLSNASSTIIGNFKVDGNATTSRMTITNGTNGVRIIPGPTTTLEFF